MKKIIFCLALVLFILSGCTQQANTDVNVGVTQIPIQENGSMTADANIVENGDTIKVEYVGKFEDGNIFDQSEGRGPLEFTVGAGGMIKGFDRAVVGMKLNEEKTVTVPPEDAYGTLDSGQKVTVPLAEIGGDGNIFIGSSIYTSNGMEGKVTDINNGIAMIEFTHPLAGKTLVFWIKVVEIEKA